jgi:PTH1 family peptidyl-tRNA hydrolase
MRIIVGLGNPGPEYAGTRHNAGVGLVDRIYNEQFAVHKEGYGWRRKKDILVAEFPDMILVKSAGIFMNESGRMITSPPASLLISGEGGSRGDLYIAHDDLDIHLGEYKIQFGKGPKEHGGINSIEGMLKTDQFWRIRIGIDNRGPSFAKASEGERYVLEKFLPEEKKILDTKTAV